MTKISGKESLSYHLESEAPYRWIAAWLDTGVSKVEPEFGVAKRRERREVLRAWGLMSFALTATSF